MALSKAPFMVAADMFCFVCFFLQRRCKNLPPVDAECVLKTLGDPAVGPSLGNAKVVGRVGSDGHLSCAVCSPKTMDKSAENSIKV